MALTITVTPGITIYYGQIVDEGVLNQLGRPTLSIGGSTGPTDIAQGDYSARLMAGAYFYAAGTLSTGVYAVTLAPALANYNTGLRLAFKASAANAGAVDIDINGLGAKNIFKSDGVTELAANDILSGQIVEVAYDGTSFQLINAAFPASLALSGSLSVGTTFAVTGASTFTGAATFNGAVTLGDGAADTLTLNGTLAGSPTLTSKATPVAADLVVIQDSAASNAIKKATITSLQAVGRFTSANTAIPAQGALTAIAHGLAAVPFDWSVRLVNISAELGFTVGQEVDASIFFGADVGSAFTLIADATNISVQRTNDAASIILRRVSATAGSNGTIDTTKWQIIARAAL